MSPEHVNPLQWHQAIGFARQSCARVFRDGGGPGDALSAFGLGCETASPADWDKAVAAIAALLCAHARRLAA